MFGARKLCQIDNLLHLKFRTQMVSLIQNILTKCLETICRVILVKTSQKAIVNLLMMVLIDLSIIKFTCQQYVSGYVCCVWHLRCYFFWSPFDWNNIYCKTFDHCTLFLSESMRNKLEATFIQNLKVIKAPFFSPIYFVGAPIFLPQHWKLLGSERLMPL